MTDRALPTRTHPAAGALALRVGVALAFASATAVAAQIRIPLPFTPVPLTLQTAVVLLSGGVLGGGWGAFAMAIYLVAGAAGAPVFAGGNAGSEALLGPTGGYLLAFAVVPPLVARALSPSAGTARAALVLLLASGVVFLWGALQLALVLGLPPERAFALGVAPFLVGDLLKVAAAAAAFRALGPLTLRLRD